MTADEILKKHNLKNTGCRKHIVNELLQKDVALSEQEIKDALPDLFDRVTFYRSLKTLEENNIIHRIILNDTSVKYALNEGVVIRHKHAHFHCYNCNRVSCVDIVMNNNITLGEDYTIEATQIILEGICPSCKTVARV